jgi:hypothetical protein
MLIRSLECKINLIKKIYFSPVHGLGIVESAHQKGGGGGGEEEEEEGEKLGGGFLQHLCVLLQKFVF